MECSKEIAQNSMEYLKKLFNILCTEEKRYSSFGSYDVIVHKYDIKITVDQFIKLLDIIKEDSLVILPEAGSFMPYYNICQVEGNPLTGYFTKMLLTLHSRQLPEGFTHKNFEKYFLSDRNMKLADLAKKPINPNQNYFY